MSFSKFSKYNFLFLCTIFSVAYGENNTQLGFDRVSLLNFMSGITSDPKHALQNWNSPDVHLCNWRGVGCNVARDRVTELDLNKGSLRGTISPAIANLSYLQILDLSGNFFHGEIPPELGFLSRLKQLSLSFNLLDGTIPRELSMIRGLVYINLGSNRLSGEIPASVLCNGSSSSLEYVDFSNNSLSGEIPMNSQCDLRELRFLLLWSNQLSGQIPRALSNFSKLQWIDLESNSLTGELPAEIVNKMPELQFLYLSDNNFSSPNGNTNLTHFFASLANNSNLQELELAGNNLRGEIPSIIGDLSTNLVELHLDNNLLYGSIPPSISNLFNLTLLNLSSNLLNGSIPPELCRMKNLERLYLSNNLLSGEIPPTIGDISHLGLLDLSKNKLSGTIPDCFAGLSQLRLLLLHNNRLSGTIPASLGKCINLEILDFSHNMILGHIPGEVVGGLSSLKLYLNLSRNLLTGPIPLEMTKMDMVLAIDLSSNKLLGTIPSQLGSCIALEHLSLANNGLEGPLPQSIGQLPYLRTLDLSYNKLSGTIPQAFQTSSTLKQLNLSYNSFVGNVTGSGAFSSFHIDSFEGNPGLCGSIQGMQNCIERKKKQKKKKAKVFHFIALPLVLLSIIAAAVFFTFRCYPFAARSNFKRKFAVFNDGDVEEGEEKEESKEKKYPKISHRQLVEATGGFCESGIIGSGSVGRVYKGILPDDTRIAVKVLDSGEVSGCFKRECQVLRRTRHRNLIRIITICSRPNFKALVLPLMPNGSLENHLYPSHGLRTRLDVAQLVSICVDVAEGMAYLHHHAPVKVVHCDLKPSNILLDDEMTALVADFGIARLIRGAEESVCNSASFGSTDGLLCGSVGYIAPEYGMGKRASTQGDVYSFGVLMLEIASGKRPTDALFHDGSSLHKWVKSHYPYRLEPIVERALERYVPREPLAHDSRVWHDVMLELIELGLMCTQYNPSTRPTMMDVAHEMSRLKEFLSGPTTLLMEEEASTTKGNGFISQP